MPYDEDLAQRVRTALERREGISEKKMFGGIAFMLNGHMTCGVVRDHLMLRLGEDGAQTALEEPHTRPMDFTGKPLKTMIYLDPPGFSQDAHLEAWVDRAVAFARGLPPK